MYCNKICITFIEYYILVSFKFWCKASWRCRKLQRNISEQCKTIFIYLMCLRWCHKRIIPLLQNVGKLSNVRTFFRKNPPAILKLSESVHILTSCMLWDGLEYCIAICMYFSQVFAYLQILEWKFSTDVRLSAVGYVPSLFCRRNIFQSQADFSYLINFDKHWS